MREQAELVEYGFEDDPRYRNEKRPSWAGRRPRHRNYTDYLHGQALRHLTDDPEESADRER